MPSAAGSPRRWSAWSDTDWGPALDDAVAHVGVRLVDEEPRHVGWGLLVEGVVEHVDLRDGAALVHTRGRYGT